MSRNFEVPEPILNSPFEEPAFYWHLEEGRSAEKREGRRPAMYYYRPPNQSAAGSGPEGAGQAIELELVNLIRARMREWRETGGIGSTTRITQELLAYWRRDGRRHRLFFAQLEALETIIFLREARADLLQGITVPWDEPSADRVAEGYKAFLRYACKMATGSGKTTVMAMLAAWSILNKVNNRSDGRFSDTVLVVCPNVTIRNRLAELDPDLDEASLYRTRDLVPRDLMPDLRKGRVLVTNWHVFEPRSMQAGGVSAKVVKTGRPVVIRETITIGDKTTTARGTRYLSLDDYRKQVDAGLLKVLREERDKGAGLKKVEIESTRYVESDTALINRVLGREVGGKQNILVFNDEAHHAYRIKQSEPDETEDDTYSDEEEAEEFFKEATVWVDGLDRINKLRGINFCVDLSATPYFLGRVGQETNRPFPWVVSDFGLTDAIESGLVKIPQLAVRDTSGAEIPGYFNIWKWIQPKLTASEKGGKKGSPKPEAILRYAHTPLAMLGSLWEELRKQREERGESRPPVFIIVCKNTRIAKVVYDWLAEDKAPTGIPTPKIEGFRNRDGQVYTIRADTKVIHETDSDANKNDEDTWMRRTLDTIGRLEWPKDQQGRPVYPDGFEVLAQKLGRPLSPPGRDVRCIVSVGMLTEGWDCNTVTHIIGLRPFTSQLLCEQVVGRGLRRFSYEVGEDGKLTEEVSKILGVPFEIIPFKANPGGPPPPPPKRHHVCALPERAHYEIRFPRVEGYNQAIRNRVTVDWDKVSPLFLDPTSIPPEIQMKAMLPTNTGRPTLLGPGDVVDVTLNPYRYGRRLQELVFDMTRDIVRDFCAQPSCTVPAHALFVQIARITDQYLRNKVKPQYPAEVLDVFCAPYYGWVVERIVSAIVPDTSQGEAPEVPKYERNRRPGSTADVDYWTVKPVREVEHSHVNFVVADTKVWEQSAAYFIDKHPRVECFVKNAGLGFAIPYLHNGQMHDYIPDFIVRLKGDAERYLILETKGYDELAQVKQQAAIRWANAVNADGQYGHWQYAIARKPTDVKAIIDKAAAEPAPVAP